MDVLSEESRGPKHVTFEEALELVKRTGIKLWHDRRTNVIRIAVPGEGTYVLPYDEEVYRKLKEARAEAVGAAGGAAPRSERPVTTDVALWNTWIARRRPLIEELISRVGWFQSAVLELGANTILLAMLITEPEDADRLPEIVSRLKDKDQFVGFIMNRLVSLYQASKGAEEVVKLRERVVELEAENALLRDAVEKLREAVSELRRKLDIALAVMTSRELRRFARVVALSSVAKAVPATAERAEAEEGGEELGP